MMTATLTSPLHHACNASCLAAAVIVGRTLIRDRVFTTLENLEISENLFILENSGKTRRI